MTSARVVVGHVRWAPRSHHRTLGFSQFCSIGREHAAQASDTLTQNDAAQLRSEKSQRPHKRT
jgi:hypothetical protein